MWMTQGVEINEKCEESIIITNKNTFMIIKTFVKILYFMSLKFQM